MTQADASQARLDRLAATATEIERYVTQFCFDSRGILRSSTDSHTDRPFDPALLTPRKVPRRAAFDPWSYWTYEDSVMCMGLYLDGLVLQYEVTGTRESLDRARRVCATVMAIYSCSQVHGIGSFLRPYGGFEGMQRFMEPLGTDQASPLFSGLWRYLAHAPENEAEAVRRMMLQTLEWYEQQGFEYFYYKSFIHTYAPGSPLAHHANSYYLPAMTWAHRTFPEDPRWGRHLTERLGYFVSGDYQLYRPGSHQPAFCWGSDLAILKELLGERFDGVFNKHMLDEAFTALKGVLASYDEPGTVRRVCPESRDPGFRTHVAPDFDPDQGLGFAYSATRHQGRARPRQEIDFLIALAAIGYRREEAAALAARLLSLRAAVPRDFTHLLADDYEQLPETVHLYARSVGPIMIEWWRDYWLLRNIQGRVARRLSASP